MRGVNGVGVVSGFLVVFFGLFFLPAVVAEDTVEIVEGWNLLPLYVVEYFAYDSEFGCRGFMVGEEPGLLVFEGSAQSYVDVVGANFSDKQAALLFDSLHGKRVISRGEWLTTGVFVYVREACDLDVADLVGKYGDDVFLGLQGYEGLNLVATPLLSDRSVAGFFGSCDVKRVRKFNVTSGEFERDRFVEGAVMNLDEHTGSSFGDVGIGVGEVLSVELGNSCSFDYDAKVPESEGQLNEPEVPLNTTDSDSNASNSSNFTSRGGGGGGGSSSSSSNSPIIERNNVYDSDEGIIQRATTTEYNSERVKLKETILVFRERNNFRERNSFNLAFQNELVHKYITTFSYNNDNLVQTRRLHQNADDETYRTIITTSQYDTQDRLAEETFDINYAEEDLDVTHSITYEYNEQGEINKTIEESFDENGDRYFQQEVPYTYEYNAQNRISKVTVARPNIATPHVIAYEYNSEGVRIKETNSSSNKIITDYDLEGNIIQVTTEIYDSTGSLNRKTIERYNTQGLKVNETEQRANHDPPNIDESTFFTYEYDENNNLVVLKIYDDETSSIPEVIIRNNYDTANNLVNSIFESYEVTNSFPLLTNLTQNFSDGVLISSREEEYDTDDGLLNYIAINNYNNNRYSINSTYEDYEAGIIDDKSIRIYDTAGNLVNHTYEYYDSEGRIEERDFDVYNTAGNLINSTNEDYDSNGMIEERDFDVYNTAGNLVNRTYEYYDSEGRIEERDFDVYNIAGNLINSTNEDYDSAGLLTNNRTVSYANQIDRINETEEIYENNVFVSKNITRFEYNDEGFETRRIVEVFNENNELTTEYRLIREYNLTYDFLETVLVAYVERYDANGVLQNNISLQSVEYNAQNQLGTATIYPSDDFYYAGFEMLESTSIQSIQHTYGYTYDASNRIATQTVSLEGATISTLTFEYDTDDNVVSITRINALSGGFSSRQVVMFEYDAENNLINATSSGYDSDDVLKDKDIRVYDVSGNLINDTFESYRSEGIFFRKVINIYDVSGNLINYTTEGYYTDGILRGKGSRIYDTAGNLINYKTERYYTDGILRGKGSRIYDTAGNLINSTDEDYDDEGLLFNKRIEIFDTAGNLINSTDEDYDNEGLLSNKRIEIFDTNNDLINTTSEQYTNSDSLDDRNLLQYKYVDEYTSGLFTREINEEYSLMTELIIERITSEYGSDGNLVNRTVEIYDVSANRITHAFIKYDLEGAVIRTNTYYNSAGVELDVCIDRGGISLCPETMSTS